MKTQLHDPKFEFRTPNEIRGPSSEPHTRTVGTFSDFGFRTPFRLLPSVFCLLAFCLLTSALWPSAFAQTTAFTYQGRLMDGTNVASGEYDLIFALYDSPTGTNQLGFQEFIEEDLQAGLITKLLDFGTNVFNGQDRWLEIRVRLNDSGNP